MKGPAKGMRSGPNHNQRAAGTSFAEVDVRGHGTLRLGYEPDAILDSITFRVRLALVIHSCRFNKSHSTEKGV